MPRQPKRRFTKLDTQEVSLVDTPANEKEFAVIKHDNPEATDMGAQATTEQTTTNADRVPVEVEGGEDAVVEALKHVNGIVGRIERIVKGGPGDESDDGDAGDQDSGDDTSGDDGGDAGDSSEDVTKGLSIKSVLAKAGLTGDAMKAAMAKLQKAGFNPNQKFPTAQAPVSKNDDGGDDATDQVEDDSPPMTMDDFAAAVTKAAAFTPSRISKLREAADILKLVLEAIQPNATPKTRVPTVTTHPNPSPTGDLSNPRQRPVMKNADGELIDAIKNLSGLIEGLGERVTSIEKARNGTNSVDDDGDTDSTDTETTKSLWSGVL